MRTTITLDADVAQKLQEEARKTGRPFKQVVNEFLRLGFTVKRPGKHERLVVRDVGFRLGVDFTSASELIDRLEGPFHR